MKIRKSKLILIALMIVTLSIGAMGCSKVSKAEKVMTAYKELWIKQDFKGMYAMLSVDAKTEISEEDFLARYNNIYSAIGAGNLTIETNGKGEKLEKDVLIPFKLTMDTIAGKLELPDFKMTIVEEEKEFKIKWNEDLIFPNMVKDDKIRVEDEFGSRGKILDRTGKVLAEDGKIAVVGIHPAVFDKVNREEKIKAMAAALDISEETITTKLSANTNPEFFVEIVNISKNDNKLSTLLNREKDGILVNEKDGRVYTGGKAFGRLVGYIGHVTEEDLTNNVDKGYTEVSYIGKAGLEQVYEDSLRAKDGGEIYIKRGEEKISIAKKSAENGSDIKLSIDADLQSKVYSEFGEEKGAATAVDPKSGEVLAMVSAPSYDSNLFQTYVTKEQSALWEKNNHEDEINRFNKTYSPGSTMKLLTSAIGIENGVLKPDEKRNISGMSWQKDSSWGDFKVSRVYDKPAINLVDAVKFSDNIYYAQIASELGSEKFIDGVKKFGFGEKLEFEYPMGESKISNDGTINRDILLADSGYGQGELMVTPLNVALAYSALGNGGNIMQPRLVISENSEAKVWKEKAIPVENLPALINSFSALINDADGTSALAKIPGINIAGKTGTAEIKQSQEDKNGKENGWFAAVNTDDSKIAVSMIIEDVKGRGGSQIPIPKVKNIMEYYLKR
ncbi:MAG: penicillin-binding transpeptidase domain-containing protein [Clostridium sp.]